MYSGRSGPKPAPVTAEQRGRVIIARAGIVRPRRGQTPGPYGVADALSTYRVDHARRVPDGHQALRVPFCAPHPHLQGPALRWSLWLGAFEVASHLRFLQKAVEEVLEVTPRMRKGLRRDAGPDVSPAVPEVEDPTVAGPVLVHVLREKDVQILLVGPGDILEVLPPSHGVLGYLHPLRGEASDAVGGNDQGSFGAQGLPVRDGLDTRDVPRGCSEKTSSADSTLKFDAGLPRAFYEAGVGLFAGDDIAMRTVEGGGDLLSEKGGLGVDGEARELAVGRFVQPVAEAHERDLFCRVWHEAVAARFVAREPLPVEEQHLETGPHRVVGRR